METVRAWVQTLVALLTNSYWAFPFTRALYQGPLKVVCAPGLNCYSCPAAVAACPIGALQQLLAGVRGTMAAGQHFYGLYVIGSMGILGGALGRMVCGWACPFCRTTCPLGAFYSLFNRFKLVRLRLDENACTQCQACHHVCPMGVKFNENPDDRDCTTCLACMNKACQYGAISLEIGGIPVSGKKTPSTSPA